MGLTDGVPVAGPSDDTTAGGQVPKVVDLVYEPSGRRVSNVLGRIQLTRATKLVLIFSAILLTVGGALFWWVTARSDIACAYDVLTQHQSPMDTDPHCGLRALGAAGVLLGVFGFFLAPAVIGAVVGAVYTAMGQMTDKRVGRATTEIAGK